MKQIPSRGKVLADRMKQDTDFTKKVYAEIAKQDQQASMIGNKALTKSLHALSDLLNRKTIEKTSPSCTVGCNFCCYIPLHTSQAEANILKEHVKPEHLNQLKKQAGKQDYKGMPYADRKCIFLENGNCSVYENRPLSCRNYYVYTPAELCNNENDIVKAVASLTIEELEVQHLALCVRTGGGFLPELLLQSKL